MDFTRIEVNDDADVARYVAFRHAVHKADTPELPAPCSVFTRADLRLPPVAAGVERRVARSGDQIVADASAWMPTQDNLHYAGVEVRVHPDHRRQGLGRAMLDDMLGIVVAASRRTVSGMARTAIPGGSDPVDDAGAKFAEAMGFELVYTEVEHRAPVPPDPPAVERELHDTAIAASSAEYEAVAWTGRVPDDLLAGVAAINSSFLGEAPIGDLDLERENIDTTRMRLSDDRNVASGLFMCGVVARSRKTREVVANTVIAVPTEPGDHAEQWITIVSPEHRGHRLGLLVKLENLRQLRAHRPDVRWIWTGNADVNQHMISINEQLGFEPTHLGREYQRVL